MAYQSSYTGEQIDSSVSKSHEHTNKSELYDLLEEIKKLRLEVDNLKGV